MRQHLASQKLEATKNRYHELIKILVTNTIYYKKRYLIFTKNICEGLTDYFSAFSIDTVIPSSIFTIQCNESPSSNSNNFITSWGTIDLIELGPPLLNFVVYSKIGIPPFLYFLYNIFCFAAYIFTFNKGKYNNLYILLSIIVI